MKFRCLLWLLTALASVPAAVAESPGPVVVAPLKTGVSPAQFLFLRRALKEAERENASAFVIDMDTLGGDLAAAIDNMDALLKTTVPTYVYINPRAISAGALIALAAQHIYVSPTAVIGAAAPVMGGGEDLQKTMNQKTVSMMSATARSAAQRNGHNPEIADAFINAEKTFKIGDVVISDEKSLLTLSAEEAVRKYDGKPLLAKGIANSLEDMLLTAKLTGEVRHVEPAGFERLAFWITSLAPVFLLGGIIGGYIEFKTPGFGLPGLVSIICFTIFFTGHYLAGLAGWEVAAVFGIGLALVVVELLIFPGTIFIGATGALLILGSIIFAMVDRYPSEPIWPSPEMLERPLMNLVIALFAAGVLGLMLARFLPRTAFYHRIVLEDSVASGPGVTAPPSVMGVPIGTIGMAKTTLRPSGKAEFSGQLYDVVSYGAMIEAGAPVRVAQVEGMRVVVEPA